MRQGRKFWGLSEKLTIEIPIKNIAYAYSTYFVKTAVISSQQLKLIKKFLNF